MICFSPGFEDYHTIPLRCSLGEHFHSREFFSLFLSFSLKSDELFLVFWTVCLAGFHIPSVGSFLGNLAVAISVAHLAFVTVCEVAVSESTWLAASLKVGGVLRANSTKEGTVDSF